MGGASYSDFCIYVMYKSFSRGRLFGVEVGLRGLLKGLYGL